MSTINIYKEVLEQLLREVSEEQLEKIKTAYEDLESSIKFSKLDIFSIPNLEDYVFPTNKDEFVTLINNIKSYADTSRNTKVIEKCDALLRAIPNSAEAKATTYYNPLQEHYDSLPQGNQGENPVRMHTDAEADMSNIIKVVKDYVVMNELDKGINEEIDEVIKYFAQRISDNEQNSKILYDRKYSYLDSCEKLAAYLNLNSGSKIDMEQPEIKAKGNAALVEISLYNAFLVSIVKITNYWKNKIFNHYNSIDGDNLPTDTQKRIDKLVKSAAQYDSVYKAIHIVICEIIKDKLTKFVNAMKEYQDSTKVKTKVVLTEPEALALDELFVTRLGTHAPRRYLKQWV